MGDRASQFLITFNQIEKWLKEELNQPSNMGFSEMVRRLGKRQDLQVKLFQDDLFQMSQLRNAIVHERIADDFIIAEPNEWAVTRIQEIAEHLLSPEKVFPRFKKKVTGFEEEVSLEKILKIVAEKGFSQFPIYQHGNFEGLVTVHGIGLWFAKESQKGQVMIKGKTIRDILNTDRKKQNYYFISPEYTVFQAEELFHQFPSLEALLITNDGASNGHLLGIIRPKDLLKKEI